MLLFGLAMVLMMLFRPAGLLPSAVRKRELAVAGNDATEARAAAEATGARMLEVERVTKRFGGLVALSEASFSIARGEIYGLIGPNGAGKTTLFNVLTGIYRQDEGDHPLRGRAARRSHAGPHRQARHRAHLPEHPPLRQPVGAGERDDRAPRAHQGGRGRRGPARRPHARRGSAPSSAARTSSSATSASRIAATSSPSTSPTATSAASRSRARSPRSRACSRWTSPRPA